MKTSDIREKLNKEYAQLAPNDINAVTAQPITRTVVTVKTRAFHMPKWAYVAVTAVVVLAVFLPLLLSGAFGGGEEPPVPYVQNASYFAIDINPSLSFTVDSNNRVTSVAAENRDAEVLLYGTDIQNEIIGHSPEEVSELIITLALQLGYVEDGGEVSISYFTGDGSQDYFAALSTAVGEAMASTVTLSVRSDILTEDTLRERFGISEEQATSIDALLDSISSYGDYTDHVVTELSAQLAAGNTVAVELASKLDVLELYLDYFEKQKAFVLRIDDMRESINDTYSVDPFMYALLGLEPTGESAVAVTEFCELWLDFTEQYNASRIDYEGMLIAYSAVDFGSIRVAVAELRVSLSTLNTYLEMLAPMMAYIDSCLGEVVTLVQDIPNTVDGYRVMSEQLIADTYAELLRQYGEA